MLGDFNAKSKKWWTHDITTEGVQIVSMVLVFDFYQTQPISCQIHPHPFDLPKASGPDCIPVVVLENCEPKLSCVLAELLRGLVFQIIGRFHQWSL